MIKYILALLILMVPVTPDDVLAVPALEGGSGGSIEGAVIDSKLGSPVEYANVILYREADSTLVTGQITDSDGRFNLTGIAPDGYYLEVKFIGYYANIIDGVKIDDTHSHIDLGSIAIEQAAIPLKGAEVVADRPAVEYRIDKKVIDVSKQYTAASGTAVDVLENVPSVSVDVEGTVSLRGSSNFTVLIDERPTVLEPSEALQQIPASTIENIEIITNPSARYDPDGTSGIINIITKKAEVRGRSGIGTLNLGLDEKYGFEFLLNDRTKRRNIYIGADYNKRVYPGTVRVQNRTVDQDTIFFVDSNGDIRRERTNYGLRGGIELNLRSRDLLSSGIRFGHRSGGRDSVLRYAEWTDPGDTTERYISITDRGRSGSYYSVNLDYQHAFLRKGHELMLQAVYDGREGDEETLNELLDMERVVQSGRRTTEKGPSRRLRLKLDYTLPLNENDRFESGYQSRLRRSEDGTMLFDYNPSSGRYEVVPEFTHTTEYDRNIHSLYALYAGESGHVGYQVGLRGEYTDRRVEQVDTGERFTIDRWDYFPTLHVSYSTNEIHQVMGSYTRRIERPRGWYLEPFDTWMDAYNVRRGNPDLDPEYIDSYELGYQASLGSSLLSVEAYYRITHNKIERVQTTYDANIILHTLENVGQDYTFGTEFMSDVDLTGWWTLNLLGNLYHYRVEGELFQEDFSRESFNWNGRLNNTFKPAGNTRIQINGVYNSSTVSAQGRQEGYFTADAAIRQEFLEGQLSATLQLDDFLRTAKHEHSSEGPDFFYQSRFDHEAPIVVLTISYNFNNYKQKREPERSTDESEGEGMY